MLVLLLRFSISRWNIDIHYSSSVSSAIHAVYLKHFYRNRRYRRLHPTFSSYLTYYRSVDPTFTVHRQKFILVKTLGTGLASRTRTRKMKVGCVQVYGATKVLS